MTTISPPVLALRSVFEKICQLPDRSVQFAPRLVESARLKSSVIADTTWVGVGVLLGNGVFVAVGKGVDVLEGTIVGVADGIGKGVFVAVGGMGVIGVFVGVGVSVVESTCGS